MLMDVNNCYHCRLYISVSPTAHITHILHEEGREGGIWSVMHLFERGVAFALGVWGQGHFLLTLLLLCFWCFLFPFVVVSRVLEEELLLGIQDREREDTPTGKLPICLLSRTISRL